MGFQPFERKRQHGGEPAVSITKYGNFILNSTCVKKYFTGARYAKLYWDAEERKVGVKPMKKKDQHSYSVNMASRGGVGSFSGIAFFKQFGVDYKETKRYPAIWNEKEGLVELKVS